MKKFLFLHISKCAGTSLKKAFSKTNNIFYLERYELDLLNEKIDDIYCEYEKFTIIRNPYDRFNSLYKMVKKRIEKIHLEEILDIIEDDTISYFADEKDGYKSWIKRHGLQMSHKHYCVVKNDLIIPEHVFRYENLKDEFQKIQKMTGNKMLLPHHNAGPKSKFKYTRSIIDKINQIYAKDFKLFNYKKE